MVIADPIIIPDQAKLELKDYLRISHAAEDGLLTQLLETSVELCEQFTRQMALARAVNEILPASCAWSRLSRGPVNGISSAERLDGVGNKFPLQSSDFEIDIDAGGDGWFRLTTSIAEKRISVRYNAGLSADWNGIPESLRHGIIRLAAHLFTHRDAPGDVKSVSDPPAAVAALWRPWRRLVLA